jgi:putative heme-binding domain-containing protein
LNKVSHIFLTAAICVVARASWASDLPTVAPGFKVELLHTVPQGGDSWVCMTSDGKGRLVISPQGPGGYLTQITLSPEGQVARMQKIDRPVGSAMGLAYAFDSLYVDGDGKMGFGVYRLPYDSQTDQYGAPMLIARFRGYPPHEHGAHGITLGADNRLYIVGGDVVQPPLGLVASSPFRNNGNDQLILFDNDPGGFGVGSTLPEGFVMRIGPNGENPEVFCGGLRNVYAIAVNADGELFGFDNDANMDWGLPWYRPNALYHLVSGADYGYRQGSAKWPHDYPDSWPDIVASGLGCPTGLKFGNRSNFPGKYKNALYALDWCAGRIMAVYLTPKGATYSGTIETFVEGKPLNVTDLEFGRDGCMYFITGGRKTQSSLYRVCYTGSPAVTEHASGNSTELQSAEGSRNLRRALEHFHGLQNREAVAFAWPYLDDADPFIRNAARLAIESQPIEEWQTQALAETRTNASLTALLALARCAGAETQPQLLHRLSEWPLRVLNPEQQLEKLRVMELSFIRQGRPSPAEANAITKELDKEYPSSNKRLNAELCPLLVYLQAPDVVGKTLALLDNAQTQEEQIGFIYDLRLLQSGWTIAQRKRYFAWFKERADDESNATNSSPRRLLPPPSALLRKWFSDAGREYADGSSLDGYLSRFRQEALETLTVAEGQELASWLATNSPPPVKVSTPESRRLVRSWTVDILVPLLKKISTASRSAWNGEQIFHSAGCSQCHHFGASGGVVGPDLTAISRSNQERDILESIVEPSKVIADQYRNTTLLTKDGDQYLGRVLGETPAEIELMTDPVNRTIVKIPKSEIQKRELSNISPMPQGLLNTYTVSEIADLLQFLKSGVTPVKQ